ncbi:hypothetical protein KKF97_16810, partial [Myxococcota bacterium]|nr:hypothetical protein [Myxococcota bacterium]
MQAQAHDPRIQGRVGIHGCDHSCLCDYPGAVPELKHWANIGGLRTLVASFPALRFRIALSHVVYNMICG